MALIDHSFKEYVLAHRINFSNWKLVDLDNYMNGNPYFSEYVDGEQWESALETASKDSRVDEEIKGPNVMQVLRDRMELYENYLEGKEPRSNLRMPVIKSQERESAAKAKAEAAKDKKGKKEQKA